MRRGRFLKAVNKSQFPSSCIYPIDLILAILILLYWSVQTGLALPEDICDLSFSDSITKMLSIVREANQNEFSAALAFKLPLLKTHILSPDSHGRSRVKLSPYSDIVGIRKHIHSQLCQVPSPYSVLLELFCQVTNPVGYHMPIMIHCIIVTSSSHYFAINIVLFYMSNVVSILQSCSTPQLVCPLPLTSSSWRPPYMKYQRK